MLALHYVLMYLKIQLVLRDIFNIPKPQKGGILRFSNLLIFILLDVIRYQTYGTHLIFSYGGWFGMVMVIVGAFYLVKKVKLIPTLISVYLFISLVSMITAITFAMLLSIEIDAIFTDVWYSLFGNFMGLMLLTALCKIAKRNGFRLDIEATTIGGALLFSVGILSYGFYISNFLMFGNVYSATTIGDLINFSAIVAGFASAFSIIVSISIRNNLKLKELQERGLKELLEQKKQYEELEEKQKEELRSFKHNINEHLISINELAKNSKNLALSEYINNLTGDLTEIRKISTESTGLGIIDANLYHLKLKYKHLGINFKWEGLIPQGIKISNSHITELFTNLFKNAFEAVAKIDGEKYISVHIGENDEFLYINVKNNHDGILKKSGKLFETTKADKKNHGFGVKTINEIVAKYDGQINMIPSENEFETEILFKRSIYKDS